MSDFIERAPMYDEDERMALWYFNVRQAFSGHPEARIQLTADGRTVVRRDGDDRVLLDRRFGSDIDQNWIGRMQAETLVSDYEEIVNRG